MAGDTTSTTSDAFKQFSGEYFQRLVEGTAGVYGGKARDAVRLNPDEEIELWLKPTSRAAIKALEMGGTIDDARAANTLYAHALRGEQIEMKRQLQMAGATPDQILEALSARGVTDDQIMQVTRREAYNLGKQNGQNSPKKIAEYHRKIAEKVAQRNAPSVTYTDVEEVPDGPPAPSARSA